MKRLLVNIGKDYEYLSDYAKDTGWEMPNGILDKEITGCGATTMALTDNHHTIICSPRVELIENKCKQFKDIFYYKGKGKNTSQTSIKNFLKSEVKKVMTTYDSFPSLVTEDWFDKSLDWHIVIDEFHCILKDYQFKSEVQLKMLNILSWDEFGYTTYLSATPLDDNTLSLVPTIKNIENYTKLEWECKTRCNIERMEVEDSTIKHISQLISNFKFGTFYWDDKQPENLVIFVNSVEMIVKIIENTIDLKGGDVNIICSDAKRNREKLRQLSDFLIKDGRTTIPFKIGSVPLKGEKTKKITFATSTAYFGCDFYNKNALSIVVCDTDYKYSVVNIDTELRQIVGRLRCSTNPFYNKVLLICSKKAVDANKENEFKKFITDTRTKYTNEAKKLNQMCDDAERYEFYKEYVMSKRDKDERYMLCYDEKANEFRYDELRESALVSICEDAKLMYSGREMFYTKANKDFNEDNWNTRYYKNDKEIELLRYSNNKDRLCQIYYDRYTNYDLLWAKVVNHTFQKNFSSKYDLDYYRSKFGIEQFKAKGYKMSKIEKMRVVKEQMELWSDEIKDKFKGIDVVKEKELKTMLGDIYKEFKIDTKVKCTDITIWFPNAVRKTLSKGGVKDKFWLLNKGADY